MPRVKIDYIVSFSSEDPENPASNLLNKEVSKKKWLCMKGETSCSVVLQLAKAVKISGVHIGGYHAALVEVLVARSETASDQYQVLVPSSVLVSREESRRGEAVSRVRSFAAEQLSEPAREQRWDRVRVVCSQPYNKHCKYGLSFVHIDEAESAGGAVPARLLAFDTYSSDDDDFKPGELFAKHLQKNSAETTTATILNTSAQIRQATSQALKNIADSSTKLTKAIMKPCSKRDTTAAERVEDTDSSQPAAAAPPRQPPPACRRHSLEATDTPQRTPNTHQNDQPSSIRKTDGQERKRKRSDSQEDCPGSVSSSPHTLLSDVVLVLSGYENPRRAALRNTALALGARVLRDWGPAATHLICAFPNTPKLRAVRAGEAGGGGGRVVPAPRGEWLEQVSSRRRRLPWRWFAAEPQHLRPEPPPTEHTEAAALRNSPQNSPEDPGSEADTDEEIEKVLKKQKKRRVTDVDTVEGSREAPATKNTTEIVEDGNSTDEDTSAPAATYLGGSLPRVLAGRSFRVLGAPAARARLVRYVRAYAGLVLDEATIDEDSEVDYVLCGSADAGGGGGAGGGRGARVSPAWLARCVRAGSLLPHPA